MEFTFLGVFRLHSPAGLIAIIQLLLLKIYLVGNHRRLKRILLFLSFGSEYLEIEKFQDKQTKDLTNEHSHNHRIQVLRHF